MREVTLPMEYPVDSGPERPTRRQVEVGPDFPLAFEQPGDDAYTWELDDMHWPFALVPLAADYARMIGSAINDRFVAHGIPVEWRVVVMHGYGYLGYIFDGTAEEEAAIDERWEALCRDRYDVAGAWWRDEATPRLLELYREIDDIDVDGLESAALVHAWERAWAAAREAWVIHFTAIMAPYRVINDLADLYEQATPDALDRDVLGLIAGYGDELHAVEIASEALAADATSRPAVAAALLSGERTSRDDLLALDGGPAFVAGLDTFLARHGHLGQPCDDFSLASWTEEPGIYLAELAKRIDRPADPAAARRDRLRAEADLHADRVRTRLADRPDDLAAFDRLLALAREIGPLTEGHNYWIDRRCQSHLRRLAVRVGRRLAAMGSIARADDVFFLDRADVRDVLAVPRDLSATVAKRRARHLQQQAIRPPAVLGKAPAPVTGPNRFDGARVDSVVAGELRGTAASPGVARGTARVTLSAADFARIGAGDIIVCPSSNPSFVPVFAIAGGVVTNTGGIVSHAAVVAREFGLPAVVGVREATDLIAEGRELEIDGTTGVVRLL